MRKIPLLVICVGSVFACQGVFANVEVSFVESAPKDRFVVKNAGDCELQNLVVEIDLSPSAGGLIFDTTSVGAGVEVFQPFESNSGNLVLMSSSEVKDGDAELSVGIKSLLAGESVSFTIDVDDTVRDSALGQIRVADSEIEGGLVAVSGGDLKKISGEFGSDSRATVVMPSCVAS